MAAASQGREQQAPTSANAQSFPPSTAQADTNAAPNSEFPPIQATPAPGAAQNNQNATATAPINIGTKPPTDQENGANSGMQVEYQANAPAVEVSGGVTTEPSQIQVKPVAAIAPQIENPAPQVAQSLGEPQASGEQPQQPVPNQAAEETGTKKPRAARGGDPKVGSLTAENIEAVQKQLLQQDARLVQQQTSGGGSATQGAQKGQTSKDAANSGQAAPAQIKIAPPQSNPGPGRPAGSTKKNSRAQAATAAAASAQQQQQQAAQQPYQGSAAQGQAPGNGQAQQVVGGDDAYQQAAAAYAAQQQQHQQQKILMNKAQQQQQPPHGMTSEQQLAYQRNQQRQQQAQLQQSMQVAQPAQSALMQAPTSSQGPVHPSQTMMQGATIDPNQLRQLHHQQSLQHQHAAAAVGHAPQAQMQQQAAYHHHQQQLQQDNQGKIIAQTVKQRVWNSFQDKLQFLQAADKQHAESLAKQIKKEEFQFFLKTDDARLNKLSYLDQKNQRMDEYILMCAENGGRVIPKQPEPVAPPYETPLTVEARLRHHSFAEDLYAKKLQAAILARKCAQEAIRRGKERQRRQQEEALKKQQQEETKAAQVAASSIETEKKAPAQNTENATVLIDTSKGQADQNMAGPGDMQSLLPVDEGNPFDALEAPNGFGDIGGDEGFLDDGLDLMSGLGMDRDGLDIDPIDVDPVQPRDINFDQPGDFYLQEDDFDPERLLRQQEEILEKQLIEQSKQQAEENLQRVEKIEQEQKLLDEKKTKERRPDYVSPRKRVQTTLEDNDSQNNTNYLTELNQKIWNIDLTYQKPTEEERMRYLKGPIGILEDKHAVENGAKDQDMQEDDSRLPGAKGSQKYDYYTKCAKSAIKQRLDRLGEQIIDEIMHHSDSADDLTTTHGDGKGKMIKCAEQLQDKLQMLMQGEQEVNIYRVADIEDYEFDSDKDAIEDENDEDEEDEDIVMDDVFKEISAYEIRDGPKKSTQLRPPKALGDEQQKLYQELREINQLAPERNELAHMEHLYEYWIEREQEEIQEKKYIKDYFEKNLTFDDQKGQDDQRMDRKQRQALQQQIESYRQNIDNRTRTLEKFKRNEYQAKELHQERFVLTGSDHPPAHPTNLAPQEFSFIKWYYALFPDQWRLIADIINYHPLTRGPLHCKEFMAREYFNRLDSHHRDLLLQRQKIQMQPWRETKLPWLINGREGCLMNSMTYLNKSHLQSIHKVRRGVRLQRSQGQQVKHTFKFVINAQGCLELENLGPRPQAGNKPQQEEVKAELAGQKRVRALATEGSDDETAEDRTDGRHYSDTEIQERLLNQMLARRRKTEAEEQRAIEQGTQVRQDIYRDRPLLKELMIDIVYKRKRVDEQSEEVVPKFTAFDYDPVKVDKDELDKNTPMWYALQHQNSCQMTIRVQHSTMFWLGYFIRRIMHEENLEKLKMINMNRQAYWEHENEIKNYFINQAKKVREQQQLLSLEPQEQQQALLREKEQEKKEAEQLQKEIQHLLRTQYAAQGTTARGEIEQVNELWEGKSPYYYDKDQRNEYIRPEKDCDSRVSNVMYQKSKQLWDELQFYWFQVNKNLHPRYRKDPAVMGGSSDQQQQSQQHQQAITAQHQRMQQTQDGSIPSQGISTAGIQQMSGGMAAPINMAQRQQQAAHAQAQAQMGMQSSQSLVGQPVAGASQPSIQMNQQMIRSMSGSGSQQFANVQQPGNSQRRVQYQHPQGQPQPHNHQQYMALQQQQHQGANQQQPSNGINMNAGQDIQMLNHQSQRVNSGQSATGATAVVNETQQRSAAGAAQQQPQQQPVSSSGPQTIMQQPPSGAAADNPTNTHLHQQPPQPPPQ